MSQNRKQAETRQPVRRWWVYCGVLLGLAIAISLRLWPASSGPVYDLVRLRAWEKVELHLKDADASEAKIVERQLEGVREFFNERKQGTAAFADSALSLGGKWAWLKGAVTFDDGQSHRRFLRESFEEHLFRGEELRAVLNAAVTSTLAEIRGLENTLLAQIRADLAESDLLVGNGLPALQSEEVFFRAYEQAAKDVLSVMARDLGVTIGREVVAFVAADIATKVVARLGVSAGILGAGAASGVATLGVGIGAGLLVDMILDWILRRMGHDPVGEVARKVGESLDQTRDFLTEGIPDAVRTYARLRHLERNDWFSNVRSECRQAADKVERGGHLGLRHELLKLCEGQSRVRREALRRLILVEGGLQ